MSARSLLHHARQSQSALTEKNGQGPPLTLDCGGWGLVQVANRRAARARVARISPGRTSGAPVDRRFLRPRLEIPARPAPARSLARPRRHPRPARPAQTRTPPRLTPNLQASPRGLPGRVGPYRGTMVDVRRASRAKRRRVRIRPTAPQPRPAAASVRDHALRKTPRCLRF